MAANLKGTGTICAGRKGRVRRFDGTKTITPRYPAGGPNRPIVQTVKATFGDFGVPCGGTARQRGSHANHTPLVPSRPR
jgi:hypothetical protein